MVEGWKSVWQNFEPTLAVFFMFLGNFLILQIANVEKYLTIWLHCSDPQRTDLPATLS